jgi:hypothetical protein
MGRFRPVIVAAVTFGTAAACLWGLTLSDAKGRSTPAVLCIEVGAAVTVTMLAAACLVTLRREGQLARIEAEYRRREAVLIRTISRLGGSPTGPIPALRAVAGGRQARRP